MDNVHFNIIFVVFFLILKKLSIWLKIDMSMYAVAEVILSMVFFGNINWILSMVVF